MLSSSRTTTSNLQPSLPQTAFVFPLVQYAALTSSSLEHNGQYDILPGEQYNSEVRVPSLVGSQLDDGLLDLPDSCPPSPVGTIDDEEDDVVLDIAYVDMVLDEDEFDFDSLLASPSCVL